MLMKSFMQRVRLLSVNRPGERSEIMIKGPTNSAVQRAIYGLLSAFYIGMGYDLDKTLVCLLIAACYALLASVAH